MLKTWLGLVQKKKLTPLITFNTRNLIFKIKINKQKSRC